MSHKLYNHIAEQICSRIASGEYAVDSKLASHRALASEFCISSRTVYKALAQLKTQGVFRATPRGSFVTGHGLQPNKKVIAVFTPDKDQLTVDEDPLKQEIFSAAEAGGFEIVLLKVNEKNFFAYTNFYNAPFCAGIFFIYGTGFYLKSDIALKVPFVGVNYIPGLDEQHQVWLDWRQSIFRQVKKILDKSYLRPAIACSSVESESLSRERWDCWQDACGYYNIKNYLPEQKFFQRRMIDNLPYWFADKDNAPDSILFMEHPSNKEMEKTMEILRQYNVPVRIFCDVKWADIVSGNGEFFGYRNDDTFRKLGRKAWEKFITQKENDL